MHRVCLSGIAAAALLGVSACGEPAPQPSQVTVTTPPPSPAYVVTTPPPPPQAQVEMIPPSPGGAAVWQPGHWRWTGIAGSQWQWQPGQYVMPPSTASHWVPGQWMQSGNGWVWVDGHWA